MGTRPTFDSVLTELKAMHDRKGKDYGSGEDDMANLLESKKYGIPPWVGAMLRGNDKVARIQTFVKKGQLMNESVEDSLIDLAVYAILALCLFREDYVHPSVNNAKKMVGADRCE